MTAADNGPRAGGRVGDTREIFPVRVFLNQQAWWVAAAPGGAMTC